MLYIIRFKILHLAGQTGNLCITSLSCWIIYHFMYEIEEKAYIAHFLFQIGTSYSIFQNKGRGGGEADWSLFVIKHKGSQPQKELQD